MSKVKAQKAPEEAHLAAKDAPGSLSNSRPARRVGLFSGLSAAQQKFLAKCPAWTQHITTKDIRNLLGMQGFKNRLVDKRFAVKGLMVSVVGQRGFYFVDVTHPQDSAHRRLNIPRSKDGQ